MHASFFCSLLISINLIGTKRGTKSNSGTTTSSNDELARKMKVVDKSDPALLSEVPKSVIDATTTEDESGGASDHHVAQYEKGDETKSDVSEDELEGHRSVPEGELGT